MGTSGRRSRLRVAAVVLVVLVAASTLASCQSARAGTRCRTANAWGYDSTYVLQCRRGRWTRVITKAAYAKFLFAVAAAKKAEAEEAARHAAALVPAPPPVPPPATTGFPFFEVYAVYGSDEASNPALPGAIRSWLATVDAWFASQTGGRRPRYERAGGQVVVREFRLPLTRAQIESYGDPGNPNPYAGIFNQMVPRDMPAGDDAALVFGSFEPPAPPGFALCGEALTGFAVIYTPSFSNCDANVADPFLAGPPFVIAHEMLHAMGAVAGCAPHSDGTGHVTDQGPNDILLNDPDRTTQVVLDVGRDDYYMHSNPGCGDAADAPWWE